MGSLKKFEEMTNYWNNWRKGVMRTRHEISKITSSWTKEGKIMWLREKVELLKSEIGEIYRGYAWMSGNDTDILTKRVFLLMTDLKKREKLLKGLTFDLRLLKYGGAIKDGMISPEEIAKAKDFPFTELLEFKNGKAFCPFHNDVKHPNFMVKNNRGRCFACSWAGDPLDFVMAKDKLTFVEAVRRLNA